MGRVSTQAMVATIPTVGIGQSNNVTVSIDGSDSEGEGGIDKSKVKPVSISPSKSLVFFKDLVAGGTAGAVSRTVVSPLERMKILFQVQTPSNTHFHGLFGTLRRIWAEEGWVGYFRGNGTNIIRIVPYSAVQFASYETYKKWLLGGLHTGGMSVSLSKNTSNHLSVPQTLIAGACAGITSVSATYPLDIIRTRLSLADSSLMQFHKSVQYNIPWLFNKSRILNCGYLIVKEEGGLRGLYRGLLPTILGIAPYVALNFTTYETLKRQVAHVMHRDPTVHEKLICGGTAGAVAQTITYPLDVLRRRLQVHGSPQSEYRYSGVWNAATNMYTKEGWRAFYKGMLPNLLKVVPSMSVSFVTYEMTQKYLLS
jgi:solute carrier family 25 phosphate transporter 23/24/25/41